MGMRAVRTDTFDEFFKEVSSAVDGPSVIEVRTNREQNVQHHRDIRDAIRSVLRQDVE
jgi:2-succinyl-5-enolpyruvyl-6-hydroxy-3-cyclohexene-1-carboxylate synthase